MLLLSLVYHGLIIKGIQVVLLLYHLSQYLVQDQVEKATQRADEAERKAKAALNRAETAENRGDELVTKLKTADEKFNQAGMS